MKLLHIYRNDELASVHVLSLGPDSRGQPRLVEAVESVQPPIPRRDKWVLIISTFDRCPVGCAMCDAGGPGGRPLSLAAMRAQLDHLVFERYPDGHLPQRKFKVQFARMGEPALNPHVLQVLRQLPTWYHAPGLLPSISTVAPHGRDAFFEALRDIKQELYAGGRFQFQFSLHTTSQASRRKLVPIRTWSLPEMARFGERFFQPGDRRITLNFAASKEHPIDPRVIAHHFDPQRFLVKITPLNPTLRHKTNGLTSLVDPHEPSSVAELLAAFQAHGFQTLLSIGETEENLIGSNCGQFVTQLHDGRATVRQGYGSARYSDRSASVTS